MTKSSMDTVNESEPEEIKTTITRYTCGFMFDIDMNVILVEKLKPSWQAGKLNGVGGKTEKGETQLDCMRREWKEETGHTHDEWDYIGTLHFSNDQADALTHISFFRALQPNLPEVNEVNDIGEKVSVYSANSLPENVIPNLKWIIPFCVDPFGPGHFTTGWAFKNYV